MSRKSQYITKLNNRDIQSFRLLYFAHHIPRSLMKASDCRLRSYEKQGLVEKCVSISTNEAIYKCTDKGRSFIGKLDGFQGHKPYINANSSEHNSLLAYHIANLPQHQQEKWHSERDLHDMYQNRLDELRHTDYERWEQLSKLSASACDGGVITESHIELVEVITDHYNQTMLEEKEVFSQVLSANLTFYHT